MNSSVKGGLYKLGCISRFVYLIWQSLSTVLIMDIAEVAFVVKELVVKRFHLQEFNYFRRNLASALNIRGPRSSHVLCYPPLHWLDANQSQRKASNKIFLWNFVERVPCIWKCISLLYITVHNANTLQTPLDYKLEDGKHSSIGAIHTAKWT